MSAAHGRVLELQSQVDLLERLRLLTHFGSNLVTVSGEPGAGKTWLAQRYLEAWAEDKNQSLLLCYPNQDDRQHRMTILTQIDSHARFSPDDTLVDNLTNIFDDEPCNIVIVVDNAQRLSENLVSELWMLVLEAQDKPQWSINVIFFALPRVLDPLITRIGYGQEHKPVDLEIERLSQDDADRLFEYLVIRFIDDKMEKRVRHAYSKVNKTPGDIIALGEKKMEKRIVIRSIVGSPVKIAALILLIAVILGGGYWWMLSAEQTPEHVLDDIVANGTSTKEQTVIPALTGRTKESATASDTPDASGENTIEPPPNGVNDDSNALPPAVTSDSDRVGEDDQGQRVVISSEVVDALMDGKAESADTKQLKDVARQVAPESDESATTGEPQQTASTGAEQSKAPSATEQSPSTRSQSLPGYSFSYTTAALNAMSDRSYTLQLAAFNSLQEVEDFIQRHRLQNQVYVYPTVRDQVNWYIVTYQNYPTIQMARDAVSTLPRPIQSLGPWAKSLRQVHREIERVK
ncbi:SPOR domain-containing protein [Vibrio gazogenes]|uniref:Cell division protein DamX n=1 Tax=Vibrio gazogenes TaxID=687 RepID=A0A1Z2SG52_VIBGA|nr:AAA family ATPase [Vibrio gazogenes]ASA56057.1 cell division protein DamX [Vibrio gazogenes]